MQKENILKREKKISLWKIKKQFKDKIPDYTNPKIDKACFEAEIEAKSNTKTSILDNILNIQSSIDDKSKVGHGKTTKKVCNNKFILDTNGMSLKNKSNVGIIC